MLLLHNSDVFITWEIFKGRNVVNTLSADRTGTVCGPLLGPLFESGIILSI